MPEEVSMRGKSAVIAIGTKVLMAATIAAGVLVLVAAEASAARRSQHGQVSGQQTPQYGSSTDLYESYSQGRQPYPNPDRELYVPQRGN
jgi:hypothetical protein